MGVVQLTRAVTRLKIVLFTLAVVLGMIFVRARSAKSVLVTLAVVALFRSGLAIASRFVPWSQSPNARNVAVGLAWVIGSVYYLRGGESNLGISLSIIAIIIGASAAISGLQWLALDVTIYSLISRAFRSRRLPKLHGVPIVYVLTEKDVDPRIVWRLTGKATQALWKYRAVPQANFISIQLNAAIPRPLRQLHAKGPARAVFMWSELLVSRSHSFRRWVSANAGCLVIIRSPVGTDEKAENAFITEMRDQCRCACGPVIGLVLKFPGVKWHPTLKSLGKWVECVEVNFGMPGRGITDFIAPLTDRLASTSVPIAASDAVLPEDLRCHIARIATVGFPAVADCYLRFRLSRSDVERFLALMDGFECLTKISVLTIIAFRPAQNFIVDSRNIKTPFAKELEKGNLGFGSWISCLSKFLNETVPDLMFLREFWCIAMSIAQTQLINKVAQNNQWRLPELGQPEQIGFINWVKDLRNATRGHGVISDANARDLWPHLHEIFLFMVSGLDELSLASTLVVNQEADSIPIKGWRRDLADSKPKIDNTFTGEPRLTHLQLPRGAVASLGKYILARQTSVFIWDGLGDKGKESKYLDYLSGERLSYEVHEQSLEH
jgi:hypothetical protein